MDPENGVSYEVPSPNTFSFNSPYGACPTCNGLGTVNRVDPKKVIPDDSKSINEVGIVPLGEVRSNNTFKQLRAIAKKYKFNFSTPIKDIPEDALHTILHGGNDNLPSAVSGKDYTFDLAEDGLYKKNLTEVFCFVCINNSSRRIDQ